MDLRVSAIAFVCAVFLVPALARGAEAASLTITSDGDLTYDLDTGLVSATNGITVRHEGGVLTARSGTLNEKTGEVTAEGDVRIQRGTQLWQGEKIRYNLKLGKMAGEGFRSGQSPFFMSGEALVGDRKADVYVLADGQVTTDDFEKPGYRIRAKTVVIVPGEYVEAQGATVLLGSVPVFYFPYFKRNLKDPHPRWTVTPGYRSVHGPFLLTSYNWYWNEHLDGSLNLDGRLKRGVGFGPDFNYHLPRFGDGTLRGYYLRDSEPGKDINDVPIDPDRWRLFYTHQGELRTNLTLKAAVRWQSDSRVIRDFYESEYRQNFQPSTFVDLNQKWQNFTLDFFVQPRVNEFFETVERLPEVRLTGLRHRLFNLPIFYESESSLGYYQREFEDNATNRFGAARVDTFHQLLMPLTFFGWLNITPRLGGRFTHYDETDGRGSTLTDQDRSVFNTGVEASFKASRVWPSVRSEFFEVNGLRHILEPTVNYAYVPRPSTRPPKLPQFDYELPTTRLLPIDYPDYNAIDSIDSQNVIRLGLRNKLQTKRSEGIDNLLHWALYTDWRLNPLDTQKTFTDLYSDLDLKPFSWLIFNSELRYNLDGKEWNEANNTITLLPGDRWSITLGQRYLRDSAFLGTNSGNNIFFTSLFYKFSENWGARLTLHYEAKDKVLEEQQYTLYRDFRSWTSAVTFRVRQSRDGPTDYTAAVTFSLKAYPRFSVGDDQLKPSLLLGE